MLPNFKTLNPIEL